MPGWRVIFVVAAGLSTSGCLFSAYQIASLTASGISYMVSGRSVGDHALSLAMKQDCATHRVLGGGDICIDFPQDDTDTLVAAAPAADLPEYESALDDTPGAVVANAPDVLVANAPDVLVADAVKSVPPVQLAESLADGFDGAVTPEPGAEPRVIPASLAPPHAGDATPAMAAAPVKPAIAAGLNLDTLVPVSGRSPGQSITRLPRPLPADTVSRDAATAATAAIEPRTYLVIGSFQNSENAEKLGAAHNDMKAAVMALETGGRTVYRVVAGPISDGDLGRARSRFLKAGIRNTWAVRLCQGNLTLLPCRENMLQQAQLPAR